MTNKNIRNKATQEFFQFPKLLLLGEHYKDTLTANDRQAYIVLNDRLSVSIKNNWVDDNGDIYFVYPNKKLAEILNVSIPTVRKIKKSLIDVGLLKQVSTGRADKLYLQEPMPANDEEAKYVITYNDEPIKDESKYNDQDIERMKKNLKQYNSTDDRKKVSIVGESRSNQHSVKNELPTIERKFLSDSKKVSPSNTNLVINNKDNKDNKEISRTNYSDTELISNSFKPLEKNQELEREIIDNYITDNNLSDIFGKKLISKFKMYSFNDFSTFYTFINKLIYAQKSIEKEFKITIPAISSNSYGEYMEDMLIQTFNRCLHKERFGEVDNIASYLFISFSSVFRDYAMQIQPS